MKLETFIIQYFVCCCTVFKTIRDSGSLWWTLQHDITRILGIGASQSLHTLWEQPALSYSDQTGSIKPLFFFNIVSSNTLNHNPTCGFIVKILLNQISNDRGLLDYMIFSKKNPNISTLVLSPVCSLGLRLGRFQRVSKRRHGWGAGSVEGDGRWSQTDLSGNPTHWWNGPSLGTVFEGWSGMGWMVGILTTSFHQRFVH